MAYALTPRFLLVRDTPERIDFHIEHGDYFAFLATLMGFMEERLGSCCEDSKEYQLAQDLRKDLCYVHQKYAIVPKKAD